MTDDIQVRVDALLAEHYYVPSLARGVSRCACGIQFHGMSHEHRTHVATVIVESGLTREESEDARVEQALREQREQIAAAIEALVRTPPGVEPSLVTEAYINAARIVRERRD